MQLYAKQSNDAVELFFVTARLLPVGATVCNSGYCCSEVVSVTARLLPVKSNCGSEVVAEKCMFRTKKKKKALYRDKKFEAATLDLWPKLNERYFSFLEVMLVDLWGKK